MSNATTAERATIELPREPGESARAYAARVRYVTMGPGRSIDKVADQNGIKTGSRPSFYLEWSRKYNWVACARKYDDEMTLIAIQEASAAYRADLEAHRKKAMDAGRSLFQVAGQLLTQVNVALANPKRIEGKDGKVYALHGIDLNSNSLAVAARALTAALDLEAHALGVDRLLPTLDTNDSE